MALGADRGDITRLVLGKGAGLALGGILVGAASAVWLSRLLGGLLYEVGPRDPASIAAAAAALLLFALLGCYFPAISASRADPITALREE